MRRGRSIWRSISGNLNLFLVHAPVVKQIQDLVKVHEKKNLMLFSPLLSVAQKNHLLHVWQMIPTWSWILAFVISGEVKILVYQHHCHPYIELRSFSKYILIFFLIAHPPPFQPAPIPPPEIASLIKNNQEL